MKTTANLLVTLTCCLGAAEVRAIDFRWVRTSDGFYSAPASWDQPTGFPAEGDNAIFDLNASFTTDFVLSRSSDGLRVTAGDVTFGTINQISYSVQDITIDGGNLTIAPANGGTFDLASPDGTLPIGLDGNGTLTIEPGGSASVLNGQIGVMPGSTGTATIRGAGSRWNISRFLSLGLDGDGTLTIEDGGAVGVGNLGAAIGDLFNSTGRATVRGAGSTWGMSGPLFLGSFGDGTLLVEDGGAVSNTDAIIGFFEQSTSQATVRGAGSTWSNSNPLVVGREGDGTLTIEDGGSVSNTNGTIAAEFRGVGRVTVRGAGSTWSNSGDLVVGLGVVGDGTLLIEDGGSVSNTEGANRRWGQHQSGDCPRRRIDMDQFGRPVRRQCG